MVPVPRVVDIDTRIQESRQNHGRIMALKLGFGGAVFGLTVVAGGEGKQDRVWYGRR